MSFKLSLIIEEWALAKAILFSYGTWKIIPGYSLSIFLLFPSKISLKLPPSILSKSWILDPAKSIIVGRRS